ncbi:MAG: alginate lyase family protein, partial [Rhodothermales bacterium]|nr:alginate lyase family protein [Rhodothermales bacterium]
ALDLVRNMGPRYIGFRAKYELESRLGLLRRRFPTEAPMTNFISLEDWKVGAAPFFFERKSSLGFPGTQDAGLAEQYQRFKKGDLRFFHSTWYSLGPDYDWITNPETGYQYSAQSHWTEIPDLNEKAGDIKYVWEKSRFTHLQFLIRYDYHFGVDCSDHVFKEIRSWIDANPVNRGPNFRCSQEISLRVFNWTFALYYYRDNAALTQDRFAKIMNSIYWQLKHVRSNINFSRIAVRNNHALTETLMLYLGGMLFPFFPESDEWRKSGQRWFEEEIEYQVYEDGTFLQFSMNYHRVVVQLLTWALTLTRLNDEYLAPIVEDRARKSLLFLHQCQDSKTGHLPNYGNNDGALFADLNGCDFRDYRPQLNALYFALEQRHLYGPGPWREDVYWYNAGTVEDTMAVVPRSDVASFPVGGYATIRDDSSLTFLRCGSHRDRPFQADNLHLDIWYDGRNWLRDAGSFKYNTTPELLGYFGGTASHNTVQLGEHDQMRKGGRFIWYFWSQSDDLETFECHEYVEIRGQIWAYRHVDREIHPFRSVRKYRGLPRWEVHDILKHSTDLPITQIWNLPKDAEGQVLIVATDGAGVPIEPLQSVSWYSGLYGVKEKGLSIRFTTQSEEIRTTIAIQ